MPDKETKDALEAIEYTKIFSHWYSWGSPVGLTIFFIGIAIIIVLIRIAFILK